MGMVSDDQLRLMLFACRFADDGGQRPGFVPFSAPCVASRLAAAEEIEQRHAMRRLRARANHLGGEVVEDEALWLPADRFAELWNGLVVVLAAGSEDAAAALIPAGGLVIAADRGAELALARGLHVDVAVGDFDSISPEGLAALEESGTRIERRAPEKDATDLELALVVARNLRARRILVLSGAAGRLDHLLGGLLLLAADPYAALRIDAQLGAAAVHVIRGERIVSGNSGDLISLFAVNGPAHGVVTEGLVYPLRGETLEPGLTRGVSNVFAMPEARVALEHGVLLAVRPNGSVAAGS